MENIQNKSSFLLTVAEVAQLLRTSKKAVYTMHARGQIRGAIKLRKRLLFKKDDLLSWIDRCDRSPKGVGDERHN